MLAPWEDPGGSLKCPPRMQHEIQFVCFAVLLKRRPRGTRVFPETGPSLPRAPAVGMEADFVCMLVFVSTLSLLGPP